MSLEKTGGAHPLQCADSKTRARGLAGLLGRLGRGRGGAVAAEFAMVSPILIGLMFGTVEYGLMLYSYSSMQAAARDVTRQVAVNTLPVGSAQAELKSRLPGWMRNDATISVTQTTPANAATNVYTTTVSVSSAKATPLTFFTRAAPFTLQTEVEMKQELPFM
jgi:Flp pilus assembly protein TadG